MAASPVEGNRVYYCFATLETNGDGPDADSFEEKDVYCTFGTFDEFFQWSWNEDPEPVAWAENDDKDQFNPEVYVTADNEELTDKGTPIVMWYDRSSSASNYSYRVRSTMSLDGGLEYPSPSTLVPSHDSDPQYLPRHCKDARYRFVGDFSVTRASLRHSHAWFVTVPDGATSPETEVWQSFRSLGAWINP